MIWSQFFPFTQIGTDSPSVIAAVLSQLFGRYRQGAPVRTGRFRAGLSYETVFGVGGVTVNVFSAVGYGAYVEEQHWPVSAIINIGAIRQLVGSIAAAVAA